MTNSLLEQHDDVLAVVHMNRPSGEPRPGARALCGADHRHGVPTTYAVAHVSCGECQRLMEQGGEVQ